MKNFNIGDRVKLEIDAYNSVADEYEYSGQVGIVFGVEEYSDKSVGVDVKFADGSTHHLNMDNLTLVDKTSVTLTKEQVMSLIERARVDHSSPESLYEDLF